MILRTGVGVIRVQYTIWLLLTALLLLVGCDAAFAPSAPGDPDLPDGDLEQDTDIDLDSELEPDAEDGDTTESEEAQDGEIEEFNLVVTRTVIRDDQPEQEVVDFIRQGESLNDLHIHFKNVEELQSYFSDADKAFQSWRIDFGPDIRFDLVRFDVDELEFYDIALAAENSARTGKRTVSARITFGEKTAIEYGRFWVLPSLNVPNVQTPLLP